MLKATGLVAAGAGAVLLSACSDAAPLPEPPEGYAFAADSALTGTIDFRFAGGSRAAGGFTAVWQPATPLCG